MTVALLSTLVLAGIFATAGLAKLLNEDSTRRTIESLGVPARLIRPLSAVVPAAELLVAFCLIPPATSSAAAIAVLALLIVFSAVVLAGLITGTGEECGCFGRIPAGTTGRGTLIRNVLLIGLAAVITPGGHPVLAFVAALTLSACLGGLIVVIPRSSTAPPFRLNSLSGGTVSLDDLRARGKPVMLVFLSAGCSSCAAVYAEIEQWQDKCRGQLSVAVIAGGGAARNRDRATGRSIHDHLLDSGGITASAYQVKQLPSAVVIDRRGRATQPAIAGQSAIAATIERFTADRRALSSG